MACYDARHRPPRDLDVILAGDSRNGELVAQALLDIIALYGNENTEATFSPGALADGAQVKLATAAGPLHLVGRERPPPTTRGAERLDTEAIVGRARRWLIDRCRTPLSDVQDLLRLKQHSPREDDATDAEWLARQIYCSRHGRTRRRT
jgi:hypothetical protein